MGHNKRSLYPGPLQKEYNRYMGGVDTSDQMVETNSVYWKTRRWSTTVFQHLMDIAVTKPFFIHKDQCATMQKNHKTRQCFQEIAVHLLGVPLQTEPQKKKQVINTYPLPAALDRSPRGMGRRHCKVCHRSTAWKCGSVLKARQELSLVAPSELGDMRFTGRGKLYIFLIV